MGRELAGLFWRSWDLNYLECPRSKPIPINLTREFDCEAVQTVAWQV